MADSVSCAPDVGSSLDDNASTAAQNGVDDVNDPLVIIKCWNLDAVHMATFEVDRHATVGQFASKLKKSLELKDDTWFKERKMVIGEAESSFDHDSLYFRIMQTKAVKDLIKTGRSVDCRILTLRCKQGVV